jgi:uncharacterized membrane protein
MQPEEKEMLKKALELSQENNKILHSIRRQMLAGRIFRIVYWVAIVGAAIGVYYYITPYIDSAVGAYGGIKNDLQNFGNLIR